MQFDVAVIGAGAAGLMAAGVAGQRGLRVVLIDHAPKLAEKIRISGGGRCNFTNVEVRPDNFISADPKFCATALARYTPRHFLKMLDRHRISWHEKHKGQLFCDRSSEQIIDMLRAECAAGKVQLLQPCKLTQLDREADRFVLLTDRGAIHANEVIVATGGLSIPKIGATDLGYRLARRFNIPVIDPQPALVPLTFTLEDQQRFGQLAGIAAPVSVRCGNMTFDEDLLFTHRGLSGPAILQISSYWNLGDAVSIDLLPGVDLAAWLIEQKSRSKQTFNNVLSALLPRRLIEQWSSDQAGLTTRKIAELGDAALRRIAAGFQAALLYPNGSEGWRKAEVTRGGVDTRALCPTTMAVKTLPSLYFIGEVVDVTGWLGGYNFQWAWASGQAAGLAVGKAPKQQ